MVKVIVDPGSTHMGKLTYAHELIDVAKECGADAIKFQLFKKMQPNIPLPYDWFPELKRHADQKGIEIFASVWDVEGLELLCSCQCNSIKFAYSQRHSVLIKKVIELFNHVYISGDIMTPFLQSNNIIRLFCIPEYPVQYKIDFEKLFPRLFHGFSDHTLGYQQTIEAVRNGALYIEKHITLDKQDIECPDSRFALKPNELKEMMDKLKFKEK